MSVEIYDRESLAGRTFEPLDQEVILALVLRAQSGDREARDRLVLTHMRYILAVAKRMKGRSPIVMGVDDLVTEGVVGLLSVISKWDAEKAMGAKFLTYASWFIRQQMWMAIVTTRSPFHGGARVKVYAATRRIERAFAELERQGVPYDQAVAELAKKFRIRADSIPAMELLLVPPESLDAPVTEGGTPLHDMVAAGNIWTDARLARARMRFQVQRKIEKIRSELSPRELAIFDRRLNAPEGEEATLLELAESFGVSRQRILQNEEQLKDKLSILFHAEWRALKEISGRARGRYRIIGRSTA